MSDYEIPAELRYSKEDEWARKEDPRITIGITDYAQQLLGDIVFVELPALDERIEQGATFGVIESVKAVSDLYAPVSGVVIEVNPQLEEHPEYINEDCYGDGWMIKVQPDASDEFENLLDAAAYQKHIDEADA